MVRRGATYPACYSNMATDLNAKYRPALFDDVFGQGDAVEYLRGLIQRGQQATKVILTGPVGTGKTTLARIYGKALNCLAPTDRGNPCEQCAHCRDFPAAFQDYRELDCAADPKGLTYGLYLNTLTIPPMRGTRRVLVLDEAHRLPRAALDRLLKPLESLGVDKAVIILTVDSKALPISLRSRCLEYKLKLLSRAAAMELLQKVCQAEGMQWEDEALRFIVELSQGHARSLLTNLEQVTGVVTVDNAQRSLILGHGDTMARYLIVVLERDYGEQMRLVGEWLPEQPALKLEIIREFLLFLYNEQIRGMRIQTRADFLSVPPRTRQLIVERFRGRAESREVSLEEFWHDVMGFWSQVPEAATDVVLLTIVARFDYLLNGQSSTKAADDARPSGSDVPVVATAPRHRLRKVSHDPSGALLSADPHEYLSAKQVCKLIDAASVLTQGYGVMLNMRMVISFARLGIDQRSAGAKLLGDTVGELHMRLQDWGTEQFYWLYVHEYSAAEGHTCQFVAHIPKPQQARVGDYLREKIAYKAGGTASLDAQALEMPSATFTKLPGGRVVEKSHQRPAVRRQLQRHWDYARLLCRGLDPRIVSQQKPLVELLGIPERIRRPAGQVGVRRLAIATAIGEGEMRRAREECLPYLSAFADGAWSRIGGGWELDEYADRREVTLERKSEEDAIRERWWKDDARQLAEVDELRALWPRDPHVRSRPWPVWW
jgi:DNA polymerase III subunit gamma/tau